MLPPHEAAGALAALGLIAFTTTREAGSFGMGGHEPVSEVLGRWAALRQALGTAMPRLATASQVHGSRVVTHGGGWSGWLRVDGADGHATAERGTAMAVTIADCVPVFLAHPRGPLALLHAGWRGTAAGILEQGVRAIVAFGAEPAEIVAHFGPAICGRCYEVSPDVHRALTGMTVDSPTPIDLRRVLSTRAEALGLRRISSSASCTRCGRGQGEQAEQAEEGGRHTTGNQRFFSHRAGDTGRQIAVLALGEASAGRVRA